MKRFSIVQGLAAVAVTLMACGASMRTDGAGGGSSAMAFSGGMSGGLGGGSGASGGMAGASGGVAGASGGVAGAAGGMALTPMYPPWVLTDIQPRSPMAQQTYGLAAFQGRPVVAVLIEGF